MSVSMQAHGSIAVVRVDNPPVNALSQSVRQGLLDMVRRIDADDQLEATILICEGRTFIAGADVKEFGKPPMEPHLTDVIDAIELATTPWIAALHGTALGGGLEVALGCRYRVAVTSAKVGLPEVTLGIIPGAGGTVRLPRLIPVADALDLVTSGKPIGARKAEALGLIDRLIDGDLLEGALAFASSLSPSSAPLPVRERPMVGECLSDDEWNKLEAQVAKKAKGQHSPLKALASVRNGATLPFADAYAKERELFLDLRASDQAKALRHAFFAERAVGKLDDLQGVTSRDVNKVAVIGGGAMGAGIVMALINSGFCVTLVERDAETLSNGVANVQKLLAASVKRGLMTQEASDNHLADLGKTTDYADLSDCDLAIEAVFESMAVKQQVFEALDANMKAGAILATNTSYLDVDAIAAVTSRPQDVIGLHFFSPAHIMKLLEIVQAKDTAPDVLATGLTIAKKLRKVGVRSGVCDGFIGNRILKVYRQQAEKLLLRGATPADIDQAMRAFGMPMGPFEAQDLGGLDIAWAQRKAARAERQEVFAPVADRLCALERFGQKRGAGWYKYEEGSRTPVADPVVEIIIGEEAEKAALPRIEPKACVIQQSILFPMINEACFILEEGIANRPLDIDMVEIHGYGFPRWRGGLMHYADHVGLATVIEELQMNGSIAIASILFDLVQNKRTLSDLN